MRNMWCHNNIITHHWNTVWFATCLSCVICENSPLNTSQKCDSCFTCEKRWSSLVLTEPGRRHPRLVPHPNVGHVTHVKRDIVRVSISKGSTQELPLGGSPQGADWICLRVRLEAGTERCPRGWRWWTPHCRGSGRWWSRPPGLQCLCAYPGPPRFAVTGNPNA